MSAHQDTHSDAGRQGGRKMTGAEIFVRSLIEEKVEVVFGYPGGATIGVYDALHDISDIKHVLTRHEQGATHAAEGYAKATGRPGVVLVTSGPGATNTVTGIADAYMDSIPLVVFTGQVPLRLIGNDAFQEADIVGITRPVTKHNYLVRDVTELARTIKEAFYIATSGRPGPVLVDLPKDVMAQKAVFEYPERVSLRSYTPTVEGHGKQIVKAAELINKAKRPVLYVGGGTILSNAAAELTELARKLNCPVTTTLHGMGAFPETDPLSLGMLGMHGTWYSNTAVNYCDVLIAVGARFDDRVTGNVEKFAPEASIVHIDVDPAAISKNVAVDVPIVGDVRSILPELTSRVNRLPTEDWLATIDQWKREHPLRYSAGEQIRAQYVIQKLGELTGGNAVVVTDVGQHQMWAAQFFTWVAPRTHITSGGLGTMGFSLPAAMGAAFAHGPLPVISISGRRRFSDEYAGNGHDRRAQAAPQDPHHQQRVPRDGPPVAGAVLARALFPGAARKPRLREAGGGVRMPGQPRHAHGRGRRRHQEVARAHRRADPPRVPRREGRQRLPDDPRGSIGRGDARLARTRPCRLGRGHGTSTTHRPAQGRHSRNLNTEAEP